MQPNMTDVALAEAADFYRIDASVKLDPKRRVALGQYVTPIQISRFMASLFTETLGDLRVLDAVAGVGSLTAAFSERICEETAGSSFAPRYAPGAEVIYVGDTGDKVGLFDVEGLADLGVTVDRHGQIPNVVLYLREKNWLLLVEAVTSHGPMDGKRHNELAVLFGAARAGLIYVTAFPDRRLMARYLTDISWETEVWCADAPSRLIHFDGERFLGPYEPPAIVR